MSALPADLSETIPGQDETHDRIHDLLESVVTALLEEQPALAAFADHRPERDRSSGTAWRGLETSCHVGALLVSYGRPDPREELTEALLGVAHRTALERGMQQRSRSQRQGIHRCTWSEGTGDQLELHVGVRVALRAISGPFLPGSLAPRATTSPSSPLSALTPPQRYVR